MSELFTAENFAALLTLSVLEIVLGIDNVVIIAIVVSRLEPARRDVARRIGLFLAMFLRILLLLTLTWMMGLTKPLVTVFGEGFTGRDLVLIVGGFFLVWKAWKEIWEKLKGLPEKEMGATGRNAFALVIAQIIGFDLVFSLDSIITAIGMVQPQGPNRWHALSIMITAIVIAVIAMLLFSGSLARFIDKHPTTKMLALAFLLAIGGILIVEGFHIHVPKAYIYVALAFSVFVELLNQIAEGNARGTNT